MFEFTHQDLRRLPTTHEHILWGYLKARQMVGLKFRRQHPIGPFIADFACLNPKVIIELDGPSHEKRKLYDEKRDDWLKSKGYSVLRFKNIELYEDRLGVLTKIRTFLLEKMGNPFR